MVVKKEKAKEKKEHPPKPDPLKMAIKHLEELKKEIGHAEKHFNFMLQRNFPVGTIMVIIHNRGELKIKIDTHYPETGQVFVDDFMVPGHKVWISQDDLLTATDVIYKPEPKKETPSMTTHAVFEAKQKHAKEIDDLGSKMLQDVLNWI